MSGLDAEVADLLVREAYHIDRREWQDWLALYAEDALYWAPAMTGEDGFTDDPDNAVSLIYLDRAGLEARVFRIESGDSYASMPLPRTAHLVTNVRVLAAREDEIEAAASWLVWSFRRADAPVIRGGLYDYVLARGPAGLLIRRKKVTVLDDRIVGAIDFYNI